VFHVKHEGWTFDDLPPERRGKLEQFLELLETRAVSAGLISRRDRSDLWARHILDSLRGAPFVPVQTSRAADLGTGAGLPGIPLAIALPHVRTSLVDARRNRAAFLEFAVADLGLPNVEVVAGRVEDLPRAFDICLARGFARPAATWEAADRALREGGRLLYWAGASFDPSAVPPGARLVELGEPALESGGPIAIMARQ
jgi:16S rRNA (guanine527-N7)-methyltransferase